MAAESFFPLTAPLVSTVDKKDRWKLRKPHPMWRTDVRNSYERQRLWSELPENERVDISYQLGARRRIL
tara:strand:- start:1003 stop:1209 length:207 start_codon:yes stop_codon:yes gene_type:complete